MTSSIKLVSGAAILLAALSGQAIAQETIKVGMSGKYFPFTFVKQDKLQGFEVDMWNQIGERTGYKVEFVTASFSGLFGYLFTRTGLTASVLPGWDNLSSRCTP